MSNEQEKLWYVGAMNDGLFVIDAPPRPSTGAITDQPDVNVIVALATNREAADLLVREHNARVALLHGRLDCPVCNTPRSFVIDVSDEAVGFCLAERRNWRIVDNKCETKGCYQPRATFGDLCMDCLAKAVDSHDN